MGPTFTLSRLDAAEAARTAARPTRCLAFDRARLVVNPASVGLPAYRDDAPHPHLMEAGSPHARYALVEAGASGVRVAHVAVPYDHEAAAGAAAAHGREDWAWALRTGRDGWTGPVGWREAVYARRFLSSGCSRQAGMPAM